MAKRRHGRMAVGRNGVAAVRRNGAEAKRQKDEKRGRGYGRAAEWRNGRRPVRQNASRAKRRVLGTASWRKCRTRRTAPPARHKGCTARGRRAMTAEGRYGATAVRQDGRRAHRQRNGVCGACRRSRKRPARLQRPGEQERLVSQATASRGAICIHPRAVGAGARGGRGRGAERGSLGPGPAAARRPCIGGNRRGRRARARSGRPARRRARGAPAGSGGQGARRAAQRRPVSSQAAAAGPSSASARRS